jgi:hypothetical protein
VEDKIYKKTLHDVNRFKKINYIFENILDGYAIKYVFDLDLEGF